jgi:hypothetical protein
MSISQSEDEESTRCCFINSAQNLDMSTVDLQECRERLLACFPSCLLNLLFSFLPTSFYRAQSPASLRSSSPVPLVALSSAQNSPKAGANMTTTFSFAARGSTDAPISAQVCMV